MRTLTWTLRNRTAAIILATSLLLPIGALPAAGQAQGGPPALEAGWTVSPDTVASGDEVDLVFTFVSGSAVLVAFPGSLVLGVPTTWDPRPQTADETDPGLVEVDNVSCDENQPPAIVEPIDVSDADLSEVSISLKCGDGESFTLTYHDVTAPTVTEDTDYTFPAELSGPPGMDPLDLAQDVTVTAPVDNDADDDGVLDDDDLCAETPTDEVANDDGCSPSQLDDDGDNVSNADDLCPGTPADEIELVDEDGCSPSQLDDDDDGVSNADDLCPNTPAGQPVDATGCPTSSGSSGGGGGGTPEPLPTPETPAAPPLRCVDEAPWSMFLDVPQGHIHERAIDCIAWKGITTGTSRREYSPGQVTTRAQMASFVARTIRDAGGTLPTGGNAFTDDNGNVHQAAINQLAAAGIVVGKAGGQFDPNAPVRRDQMATMLMHAYAYLRDEQVGAGQDHFIDDNGNVHEPNINASADLGLTFGTGNGRYNPAGGTRRDQMAAFLTRLLERLST